MPTMHRADVALFAPAWSAADSRKKLPIAVAFLGNTHAACFDTGVRHHVHVFARSRDDSFENAFADTSGFRRKFPRSEKEDAQPARHRQDANPVQHSQRKLVANGFEGFKPRRRRP
eukprot:CAMPEP_0172919936 /NCGR_PEP_ID=MMETSP1075-20121228/203067_1 /TAXON_ID=2916 /ORGANISM="Ceratium fusus, Strain PA161109" /LENGTH=115 /DNA_ID=CAMNT_0013779865 /DNA_START=51 /DNA_END=395 /DNA_ORIENTATION=-